MTNKKEAVLTAGQMIALVLDPDNKPDLFTVVDGIISAGATGEKSEPKDQTTLADKTMRYGTGIADTPDKSIKANHYPDNLIQESFIDLAIARKSTKMMSIWSSGRQAVVDIALLGFEMDETTGSDWETFTVAGKQSGETKWNKPSEVNSPTAFDFSDIANAVASSSNDSDTVVVSGLGVGKYALLSVLNGMHKVNGGTASQDVIAVEDGDSIVIQTTASADSGKSVLTTVNIGGTSDTFTTTTA